MTKPRLAKLDIAKTLSVWMIPPAAGWRRKSKGAFVSAGLIWPLTFLVSSFFLLAISVFFTPLVTTNVAWHQMGQGLLLMVGLASTIFIVARIQRQLLDPLTHLRFWAIRMRGGNLLARIPEPNEGEFAELANDINTLSNDLCNLTRDMQEQVRQQTERVSQQSHSLKILYEVATTINNSRYLDELLNHFLHTLKTLLNAKAASVRLLNEQGELRLVSSVGLDESVVNRERVVSLQACQCGSAAKENSIKCQTVTDCGKIIAFPFFDNTPLKMIAVPMKYRGKVLGIYNLFVEQSEWLEREELTGLLTSIGQHLGVAIAKSHLENEAKRFALMEERTLLSQELHDSLAQTLASMRFKVRLMEETLASTQNRQAKIELTSLNSSLEKANADLRDLLGHFRTRMDERGLVPALADIAQQFQNMTGIATFFHDETRGLHLSPSNEVQVLHIIQEALSNVRKHSQAKHVRILLRADDVTSEWYALIEDDGQGMRLSHKQQLPGEHIGLAIMRERACHLHGSLSIESEPGEGTRVELRFSSNSHNEQQGVVSLREFSEAVI